MRAVAYRRPLPVTDPTSLQDIDLPDPVPLGLDLLVKVCAVSVNPLDTKLRGNVVPDQGSLWKVLGFDAAGVVVSVGERVTLFKPGDRVWYAGCMDRPGTNSELHLVDERIAGHMPSTLDFCQAAALPLTTITAWEMLFDRFGLVADTGCAANGKSILLIGAAGGVGSIMTQLARRLTGCRVIGTASRPETSDWVRSLGAHDVISHAKPLVDGLKHIGVSNVDYIACLSQTDLHAAELGGLVAPQGKIGLVADPKGRLDINDLRFKSVSLHWETMFTRPLFQTADMVGQHMLLNRAASLVEGCLLVSTLTEHLGAITAKNLRSAHALVESGRVRGKVVLG